MTKHLPEDALKYHLVDNLDASKIEVVPQLVDNRMVICGGRTPDSVSSQRKLKARAVKPKVAAKKTRLGKVMQELYDLESGHEPEKVLNIDLGLYQMEDY